MLQYDGRVHSIRWHPGERLSHLFEDVCDRLRATGRDRHVAIAAASGDISFDDLDRRANRLARQLLSLGVAPGSRVALMLDKSGDAYVALIAAIKINATFVPLDASFPADRVAYICADAGVSHVLCVASEVGRLGSVGVALIALETAVAGAAQHDDSRLREGEDTADGEPLAYIVYTSGSTGQPKGCAISHASICNFVRVAGEVYGIREDDRVYQGMTLAFDFSTEELWVPLIAGATLVPGRSDVTLVGQELARYLITHRVTGLCCVPTLLATIDAELPLLRFLLVSGEACPQDLVARWHRPGRRMLNAYGPTEATVTASWTELAPGKPVTIGVPLPTYTIVILGEDGQSIAPDGTIGEIGIAGAGLAVGYVNRPDLTAKAFIPDVFGVPDNPSGRIYRTGDLGRINGDREIEYHGRIDTQVKVRGYRIELTEIESVLLEHPSVAQAVVTTVTPGPGQTELAAYITRRPGTAALDRSDIARHLKRRLPGFMVPAYVEDIGEIPMLPSNKADRKRLPAPAGPRLTSSSSPHVGPRTAIEADLAAVLADVLRLDTVSIADDVFADLGGDSLLMATFVAAVEDRLPHINLSIRDVYMHRTMEKLAAAVEHGRKSGVRTATPVHEASTFQHLLCGTLQYLFYVAVSFVWLAAGVELFAWQAGADGMAERYLRAVAATVMAFSLSIALPVVGKWVLVGRWREERIPIWSLRYFRFWVVRQLVQTCPLVLFRGQPIYNVYLRLLGARIGPGASINTRFTPVCTDLFTVGADAVLAKDCFVQTYRAEHGMIVTGRVDIGRGAYVGEASIVDIGTSIGDGGQLAHASSLQTGQSIPEHGRYWGSPAEPCAGNFIAVEPRPCGPLRRRLYTTLVFLLLLGVALPGLDVLSISAASSVLALAPAALGDLTTAGTVAMAVALSLGVFVSGLFAGLIVGAVLPRLLGCLVRKDTTYPLYGWHYAVACLISWFSNSAFYNILFGDSSLIVHYLRVIGFDLGRIRQTGSNFGSTQRHDIPWLNRIGSGTMASDGLSLINIRQSSTSFRLVEASIGDGTFLGNQIVYIGGAKLGPGNLLATKVMVPLDGPELRDVGLLGSPPFEIPRTVIGERSFDPLAETPERRQRLRRKNVHNLVTLIYYLLLIWGSSLVSLAIGFAVYAHHETWGYLALLASAALTPLTTVAYFVAMERWGPGWLQLSPRNCTIHDRYFFEIERYWKLGETPLKLAFKGTPFRPWIYRQIGVKVGRKVFDDGCVITEKSLTSLGDFATLNDGTSLQCHSLEDGLFKSGRIEIGRSCTIGPSAFVNYSVTIGDRATLNADSFLMKGSVVGAGETWAGNPARRQS